ncbi:DUF4127 family protein [Pectinatus sottacetonis]|uniref:DUF4127 family protein n=1 Tax=Pectinatus sottacetonis TaxID=1002795 RepID=UPI0018C4DE5A|nr:DUF4127 family protein [Pectinatus sottacetonis]
MKIIKYFIVFIAVFCSAAVNGTALAQFNQTILFVPHDNRPISFEQTANNIRALGYKVITPPANLLGSRDDLGHPEALAQWVMDNAGKADFAVLSSDSLVYGSLVASRKHNIAALVLHQRAEYAFYALHKKYPYLPIYVFSSIMRTPQTNAASSEEPAYYHIYGTMIARYTALADKQEKDGLTHKEKKELVQLKKDIPSSDINDWLSRRAGNFAVNKYLIDLAKDKAITYLALGCDDNAKYSQTDKERRELDKYGQSIKGVNYQSVAGIDEIGMILLTRAVNQIKGDIPFVSVHYAPGKGADTIPAYSNEPIKNSVKTHIRMADGLEITNDKRADMVLLLDTDKNGLTYAANDLNNTTLPRANTVAFADMVGKYLAQHKNTAVADIDFGNGADNALMNIMWQRGYLGKLGAYAGWNTPTNSSGYAISMGMLSSYTNQDNIIKMLVPRYLDDWFYQANIRQATANKMDSFTGQGNYGDTKTRTVQAQQYATVLMRQAVKKYGLDKLPGQKNLDELNVKFPWHRLFEVAVITPVSENNKKPSNNN